MTERGVCGEGHLGTRRCLAAFYFAPPGVSIGKWPYLCVGRKSWSSRGNGVNDRVPAIDPLPSLAHCPLALALLDGPQAG